VGPSASGLPYPGEWEADVVLRDGGVAHVRPIRPDDVEAIQRFHAGQSPESIYLRFFAPVRELPERDLKRFTEVDHNDRVALVATIGDRIVGIARYDRTEPQAADVAFNIADSDQGRGLGSVLLEHLAAAARERGIRRFVADVLPQNRRMLAVFDEAGYGITHRYDDGVISLGFDIRPTALSEEVREAREHSAEALSVRAVLHPRSVAVVGASRRADGGGHLVLRHLLDGQFRGALHVVNPKATEILGLTSYARVTDVPGVVDMAIIAVPAAVVEEVVSDCAKAGARVLLVISDGFAETGARGVLRQRALVRRARAEGMRVIGPNSFGVINTDEDIRLNASLAPTMPAPGGLALFSQSGALGVQVLASATSRGLGVSTFISAGNRADVSANDLLQYWLDDQRTSAVGLYLESVGNPRKFSRVARRLARRKPVIVVKSGVTSYGVPPGHEVRPTRVPRGAYDAMLRQAGVIRVPNVHQMFDVAQLVMSQPLPEGQRVGIVGNSDAMNALAAEASISWGLDVAHGPVTLAPQAPAEDFIAALSAVFATPSVDAVIASFMSPLVTPDETIVGAVADAAAVAGKPCVATFLGMRGVAAGTSSTGGVPTYSTPEDAVRALASVSRYATWRRRGPGQRINLPGIDVESARALVRSVLVDGIDGADQPAARRVRMTKEQGAQLLAAYGVSLWPWAEVREVEEAIAAAARFEYPVALKSSDPTLRQRADLVARRLTIESESELRLAFATLSEELATYGVPDATMLLQPMAAPGIACMLRTTEDPLFGPVVSFGVAGAATELLDDVAHRIPPLTDQDVADLVTSIRAAPLLYGHRGAEPLDVDALQDVIARLAQLADDLPEVADLDITPVLVGEFGLAVLDVAVELSLAARSDADRRRLL
jgi:acyl-CoA synthetase (NDP forming)/RimJ/RimL family protein N-acetyltransferase